MPGASERPRHAAASASPAGAQRSLRRRNCPKAVEHAGVSLNGDADGCSIRDLDEPEQHAHDEPGRSGDRRVWAVGRAESCPDRAVARVDHDRLIAGPDSSVAGGASGFRSVSISSIAHASQWLRARRRGVLLGHQRHAPAPRASSTGCSSSPRGVSLNRVVAIGGGASRATTSPRCSSSRRRSASRLVAIPGRPLRRSV